ncbi:MAG: T9SS type A sorting domain-containing protein [Bacteroidota bacterium]|jgi:photosystem II stability/assembly factor-like uncharacterized protein
MNGMYVGLVIGTGSVRFRRIATSGAVGTWLLLLIFFCCVRVGAQSIYTVVAPPSDGSSSGLRVPNGTFEHAYQRTVTFVDPPNLRLVPSGMWITRLGFVLSKGAGTKVGGSLTLYLSNTPYTTSDLNIVWSDIVGGMTRVYTGSFTIPDSAGPADVTLSAPFQYSGRSMYVAYEFQSPGPFTAQNAVFASNITRPSMVRSGFSSTGLPSVLDDISDFRPVLRFGFPFPVVQWIKIASGAQTDLNGLDIVDDVSAWACSPAGNVYSTNDGGKTWYGGVSVPDSLFGILGLTSNLALVVAGKESEPSALYSISNSDSSWSKVVDPALNVRIDVIGKTSSQSLWCLGAGPSDTVVLLTSNTQGKSWTRQSTGVVLDPGVRISRGSGFRLGNVVWFGTGGFGSSSGRVYRSSTGPGGPWSSYSTGRANVAAIGFGSAAGTGLAANAGCIDTIRRSTDGGVTWSAVTAAGLGEVTSLQFFAGGQDAWAATSTGIWCTSDDGLTWQRSFSSGSSSQTLSSIRFYPNFQSGLAVGSNGFVVRGIWVVNPVSEVSETLVHPSEYSLGLNYPNPFNSSTWIEYSVPWPSLVTLKLIDVLGREVATIVSGERDPGKHKVEWNAGKNPSGVYFYRLVARPLAGVQAKEYTQTQKLILLK